MQGVVNEQEQSAIAEIESHARIDREYFDKQETESLFSDLSKAGDYYDTLKNAPKKDYRKLWDAGYEFRGTIKSWQDYLIEEKSVLQSELIYGLWSKSMNTSQLLQKYNEIKKVEEYLSITNKKWLEVYNETKDL